MTAITALSTIKEHLKVDGSEEDSLLEIYIAAAESYVNEYCDRKDTPFTTFTPTIAAAVLLIVADLYENRSAQVEKELYDNKTVKMLLNFNRTY